MNRGKGLYQRPTIEGGASIDAVICYPATTPNEYIQYQAMDWGYDYDRYHSTAKKDILESLTDNELRSMIAEKRMNVEFNEKQKGIDPNIVGATIAYFHIKILSRIFRYGRYFQDKNSKYPKPMTNNSIIDIVGLPIKYWIESIEYLTKEFNAQRMNKLNEPLIKCILLMDRELRQRSDEKKANKVDLVDLKNRVDILEVVQSYVSIGRYKPGQLIKCPLPTHNDGSASCMLYRKTNQWHCFGCHQGGSQIDFIMLMSGCSIGDAIKKLSNF